MKNTASLTVIAVTALLSGCSTQYAGYTPYIPLRDIAPSRNEGWRPYTPAPRDGAEESAPDGQWTPVNPGWGTSSSDHAVERGRLPTARDLPAPSRPSSVRPSEGMFNRAEPRDPPNDISSRRVYSSRPGAATEPSENVDASAFGTRSKIGSGKRVRSEWADRAIRDDNRSAFDAMVIDSVSVGRGTFEDEAGRIYFGERSGTENGCPVVEITVTTRGGLPLVGRGTAYVCP